VWCSPIGEAAGFLVDGEFHQRRWRRASNEAASGDGDAHGRVATLGSMRRGGLVGDNGGDGGSHARASPQKRREDRG
jgi:hypothetical protein